MLSYIKLAIIHLLAFCNNSFIITDFRDTDFLPRKQFDLVLIHGVLRREHVDSYRELHVTYSANVQNFSKDVVILHLTTTAVETKN